MLIDWVTARVGLDLLSAEDVAKVRVLGDRIQRFNPRTGEVAWESAAWESIRSDSHSLSYRVGSDALWMHGSPARVIGDGDSVFGGGAAAALDLPGCVKAMASMLAVALGISVPAFVRAWIVSRIDVTGNLDVGSLPWVRDALRMLRDVEGGRYRVNQQAGDSVYWSKGSRLRKGKAYAKGPHLRFMMKKKDYEGRRYTEKEIAIADRLLRLEMTIGSQWLRERAEKSWYQLTPSDLTREWKAYFGRMLGNTEITEMNIEERLSQVAETEQQAKAALRLWGQIKGFGWERAREMNSKRTWYRYLRVLRQAGLGDADLSVGRVVEFRRNMIELKHVNSWEELRRLAA